MSKYTIHIPVIASDVFGFRFLGPGVHPVSAWFNKSSRQNVTNIFDV